MRLCSVKLLADENISPRVVSFLRSKGLDVIDVKEKGWQGRDDAHSCI
jgi:predicted nuclease of predicted toxin-antitoxin system